MNSFIDEMMGLNPNVEAMFAEPEQKPQGNPYRYKTNPNTVSKDVAPDGHYRSKVKILYNPFDKAKSIVSKQYYNFNDTDGYFAIDSVLSNNDRNCPYFKAWKQFHYDTSTDVVVSYNGQQMTKQQWGDAMFSKSEERYCLVQVIEDANQPELVGKILGMKLPRFIYTLLQNKMNPTDKTKAPVDLMNYLFGPVLSIDVTPGPDDPSAPERKNREIKYDLSSFEESEATPIIKVDGTQLFTEDELEAIQDYFEQKKVLTNSKASAKKKEDAKAKCQGLVENIKPLMERALEYLKENAIDLEKEFGYKVPSEALVARGERWLKNVFEFKDPKVTFEATATLSLGASEVGTGVPDTAPFDEAEDDLPF